MPNDSAPRAASPDADLSNKALADRWSAAAIHAEVFHGDTDLQTLSLTVARNLLAGDRWELAEIRVELLRRLAQAPYVEGCCTWREETS